MKAGGFIGCLGMFIFCFWETSLGWAQGRSPLAGLVRIQALSADPAATPEEGTAFVVQRDSQAVYIATAYHVVAGAVAIRAHFAVQPDALPSSARVVVLDQQLDLAILLVTPVPAGVEALPLQLDRQPGLGEKLFMIGYSLGNRGPAVRQAAMAQYQGAEFFLQTEVDEMDSGSPLIFEGGVAGWVKEKDGGYARCAAASVLAMALRGWQIPYGSTPAKFAAPAPDPRSLAVLPVSPGGVCTAQVISETGGSKRVYQGASRDSPVAGSLPEGAQVKVIDQRYSDAKLWYRIAGDGGRIKGYMTQSELVLGESCPHN